jgi:4-amino-4-deoxy-L-arabinose transferase-like glycosyltransferase
MQNKHRLIFSLLLISLVLPVSLLINLTDSTEGRYATIGRDMAASGDYITPMVWHSGRYVPYLGKPPLQFWMIAASINIFGANEFATRLPSFLAAALLLILMVKILRRYIDPETAGLSVCILSACPFFFLYSGSVIVDMTLALSVGAAVCCQIALMNEKITARQTAWSLAVFAALAFGMLTKGPIAVVIFGFPVALWSLWNRSWLAFKYHRWIYGILLFTAICLPWFLMAEKHNPGFLRYFFINENLMRYISHNYGDRYGTGHLHTRGTALLYLIGGCLPWFIWVGVLMVKKGVRAPVEGVWKDRNLQFLFLGSVGYVVFLCLARQLTPTYLLPVIPWVAVCLAVCMRQFEIPSARVQTVAGVLVVIYIAGLLVAAPVLNRNKSSKQVIAFVRCHCLAGPLYFVAKTPETAYFYGQGMISKHFAEDPNTSIDSTIDAPTDYLYVIKDRYMKRLSPENQEKLSLVGQTGVYKLYRKKPWL